MSTTPSVMRYQRIQSILESEPIFRSRMQPRNCEVTKKPDEKFYYCRLVFDVTNALHTSNKDPHSVPKAVVLMKATEISDLLNKPAAPVERAPVAETASASNGAHSEQPDNAVTKPRRVYRKKVKVPEEVMAEALAQQANGVNGQHEDETASVTAREQMAVAQAPAPQVCAADKTLLVYSNLGKMGIANSLRNLMQVDDDNFPGFEKRREAVDFLVNEFIRLKDMPSPVKQSDIASWKKS